MSGEDASGASRRPALLLGLTGSVATIKAAELVTKLAPHFRVKVILTAAAKHFARAEDIPFPRGRPRGRGRVALVARKGRSRAPHRAPQVGGCPPRRAVLRQHPRQVRQRHVR